MEAPWHDRLGVAPTSSVQKAKLWPLVRDHDQGEPMEGKHMLQQQLSCLLSRRQLLEGVKVFHLTEPVDNGEYDRVLFRAGEVGEED